MSSLAAVAPTSIITPVNPPANGATLEGLDHWLKDIHKYETILAEMAKASADNKFKDELATIEQWLRVLSESERTASIYTLLQHSTQEQIRFFMAVLQKMIKPEEPNIASSADAIKSKNSKAGLRPPSLDLPLPGSPSIPTFSTASRAQDSAVDDSKRLNLPRTASRLVPMSPLTSKDEPLQTPIRDKSWASLVNTPLVPMFQKSDAMRSDVPGIGTINDPGITPAGNAGSKGPGLAAINSATLEKLATSGLSNDAQLLAVQLVMSGILQPADIRSTTSRQGQAPSPQSSGKKKSNHGNWRTPSTKYPSSALRGPVPKSAGLKSSGSKNGGLKSSGLRSSEPDNACVERPKTEDFNPELLKDIPAWLRSLRLHKYTACFEGMTWQEMVVLDDVTLEKKGVAALGARRRLLRTFDNVRQEFEIEGASSATPISLAAPTNAVSSSLNPALQVVSRDTVSTRLSADSPIFLPTGKVSHSPAPTVTPTLAITSAVQTYETR